jgi:AcrR family transcriptional regulator
MAKKIKQRLEQKRVMILEEAKRVLKKFGKGTSMADVAGAINMDTSALYYYYKSIPEIIDTILDQEYHDFSLDNVYWQDSKRGPLSILKEMVTMILEFYYDNLEIMQIILAQVFPLCLDHEHEDDSVAINHFLMTYRQANDSMLEEIKQAQKKGEIHQAFRPLMILQTIRGVIFGACAAWKEEKPPREEIREIVERLFLMFS